MKDVAVNVADPAAAAQESKRMKGPFGESSASSEEAVEVSPGGLRVNVDPRDAVRRGSASEIPQSRHQPEGSAP
jgi:hypothetical protein